jgi:hypothetical protein
MTCFKVRLNGLPPYIQNSGRLVVNKLEVCVRETCSAQPLGMLPSCVAPFQKQRLRTMPRSDIQLLYIYLSSIQAT